MSRFTVTIPLGSFKLFLALITSLPNVNRYRKPQEDPLPQL